MKNKTKRLCVFAISLCFLTGCKATGDNTEIALITDGETVEESSISKEIWEGITSYTKDNKIGAKNYILEEDTRDGAKALLEESIKKGAKVVICSGDIFEVPFFEAQKEHKKVKFIFMDGVPHDEKALDTKVGDNSCVVDFNEVEAGFLVGYAAVKEGYKNLGFLGSPKRPEVQGYGTGFIQGAEYAAKELGLGEKEITIRYSYISDESLSPAQAGLASKWFQEGCEVIFNPQGKVNDSVFIAASKAENKKIIASDFSQTQNSDYIVTTAMKDISQVTRTLLEAYKENQFKGGETLKLGLKEKGVMLDMKESRFSNFTLENYEVTMKKLEGSELELKTLDIALGEDSLNSNLVNLLVEK